MYIPRSAEKQLTSQLNQNKIIIMLGARQVGKTTLVQQVLKEQKHVILNLDLDIDKTKLVSASKLDPQSALSILGNPDILVIDEAQRLPEIGRITKGWYDSGLPNKIILLGSSSLDLLDQTAEALTGRNAKIHLTPFLFSEILMSQSWNNPPLTIQQLNTDFNPQVQTLLQQAIIYGSYPESYTTTQKEYYLNNLSSDYLFKDVLQLGIIKSASTIRRLLTLLALQIGSTVSTSELARNLEVARQTVEKYIDLLEQTYVVFRLPSYSTNQRKELAKSHKIYFWDTGIRNALIQNYSLPQYRTDIGALWENWIVAEHAKWNISKSSPHSLYFWRTTEGSEIDLITKHNEDLKAFEIKWSKTALTSTQSFVNKYDTSVNLINRNNFLNYLYAH